MANTKTDRLKLINYPTVLLEQENDLSYYPSDEALAYIYNWGHITKRRKMFFGQYFADNSKTEELIEFIREIWWQPDWGFNYEDNLLELHTGGWSGNEDIIRALETTALFTFKLRATQTGGHYYFNLGNKEYDYRVEKYKK